MMQTRSWINRWEVTQRRRVTLWRNLTAAQLFVGSFLLVILVGTLGLKTLPGLYTGAPLGWLDALFTATSAVCVTGLIVVDTATYVTPAGQAWILLLIQLGGLGIITFTTLIIVLLGRRLSLRQEAISSSSVEAAAPWAAAASGAGVGSSFLRPHAKAHRCPDIALRQIALGADGICCQKVNEAVPFVVAGVRDIHISNEIVGDAKLALLARLARQAHMTVCVDHPRAAERPAARRSGYRQAGRRAGFLRCRVRRYPQV